MDKNYCCYCGKAFSFLVMRTADHLIPRSRGGLNNSANKMDCCKNCNSNKGSYYPEQWLLIITHERKRLRKRNHILHGSEIYELDIIIENLKYVIEYIQGEGIKLFQNTYLFESYLDNRNYINFREKLRKQFQ